MTDIMGTSGCVKTALSAAALEPDPFCLGANISAAAEWRMVAGGTGAL